MEFDCLRQAAVVASVVAAHLELDWPQPIEMVDFSKLTCRVLGVER